MCGIAGIWNFADASTASLRIGAMLDAMRRRGPDGRGTTEFAGGAAGMVRLALVDPTPVGDQPMWSPCGRIAVIFNGEIYNFREERRRLEAMGRSFRSQTDTEVLLALFEEDRQEFVHRLRGMFAAAFFDWRESSPGGEPIVTLVRGPFGIKPLYVAEVGTQGRTLVFASELRGILASGLVERNIHPQGLIDYLHHGFVIQPRTLIRGVRMVEAGTLERFVPGRPPTKFHYWRMPPAVPRRETFAESAERLRSELTESIRLHSLADVPVGAFLSGGIDSTCIAAMMREHVADLRTYTLQFPHDPGMDEAEIAAETARRLGCNHTTIPVTGSEVAALLPQFAADLDQPSTDGLNTWLVSRGAARDVKGVLSGLGGDEWFAGYPVAGRMQSAGRSGLWDRTKVWAGETAHRLRDLAPTTAIARRMAGLASRRNAWALWLYVHTVFPLQKSYELAGMQYPSDPWRQVTDDLNSRFGVDLERETALGMACILDVNVYMMCQLLRDSDALSMASSLELRVPFVERRIADFSRTCHDDYKRSADGRGPAKQVLLAAVGDLLPEAVKNRPKLGFTLPMSNWMNGDFGPLIEETCRPEVFRKRGSIQPEISNSIPAMQAAHRKSNYSRQVWSLLILELWLRSVFDAPQQFQAQKPAA